MNSDSRPTWIDADLPTEQVPAVPPVLVPPGYRVGAVLGDGSQGRVHALEPDRDGPRLALKLVRRGRGAAQARFDREVDLLGRARHPNLVRLVDVRHSPQASALIMEFVAGERLTTWLRAADRSRSDRIGVFRQVLGAVAAIHELGAVHRDLKPDNVLVQDDPELGPVACLIDLGIAKSRYLDGITVQGATLGTPGFLAPEQIRDAGSVDQRADLFALGCLLYLLLAGQPPFRGPNPAAVLGAVALGHRQPLAEVAPDTPRWLVRLTEALLQPRPADRPRTAQEVKGWLDRQGPPHDEALDWLRTR